MQVESFSSENSTLLHFFFQCILSFTKRKRSTLCFVVNEDFCFNFSLLISLQDSRTQWTLETLVLTQDFSIICFVVNCELQATHKIARLSLTFLFAIIFNIFKEIVYYSTILSYYFRYFCYW